MPNRAVELAIQITADVTGDVQSAFDSVGGAAVQMSDDVESSTGKAARGLEGMGSASEGLDDKFGRAAGAAGALSSGADLIGNEKASAALQTMALATDFFSGVGQLGILVTEGLATSQAVFAAESKAAAVATKAQAIAQGALNAVMSANPILLVVIAVAALVAGFVLLYKRSETFRTIVQTVMRAAGAAVGLVTTAIGVVWDWLGRVISKVGFVGDAFHAYVFVIKAEINLVVDVIKFLVGKVDDIWHAFSTMKDKVVGFIDTMRSKVASAFRVMLTPINAVRDAIQYVLDLIAKIHIPHPDLNPFGRTATRPPLAGDVALANAAGTTINLTLANTFTITEAGDPVATADAIVAALDAAAARLGVTVAQLLGIPAPTVVAA